jgi:branched-chain amino acid transport system permease protein
MGINLAHYKTVIFGVSAAYTGVAGALGALAIGFVAPDSFPAFLSVTFLVGVVISGLGSIGAAALAGALFVQFIPEFASSLSQSAPWAIYGVFLITFMYYVPNGLAGAAKIFLARLRQKT